MSPRKRILSIDVGGVLADRNNIPAGSPLSMNHSRNGYLKVRVFPHALATLRRMAPQFESIHVVSTVKAGCYRELRSTEWLCHHGFLEVIPRSYIHFCHNRLDKAGICARIGATHHIDDRLEVLASMVGIVERLIVFRRWPPNDDTHLHLISSGRVLTTSCWKKVGRILTR